MSDIQRWWPDIEGRGVLRPVMRPIPDDMHPDDEYVTYADHVAAVEEAFDTAKIRYFNDGRLYEGGLNVAAVAAAEWQSRHREQSGKVWADGYEQGVRDARDAVEAAEILTAWKTVALAAIDALKGASDGLP